MNAYRGLFYFFMTALLFYTLLSSKIFVLQPDQAKTSLLDKLLKMDDQQKQKDEMMIVETFVEMEKPKNPKNISNLNSLQQGRITQAKGYSYFSDTRFLVESDPGSGFQSAQKEQVGAILAEQEIQKIKKKSDAKKKVIDLLPNLYTRKQIVINMDSDGFVGVSAQNREYAEYLMTLAKKIFYNWVDFLPGYQIKQSLIKTNPDGSIFGTIGLYYDKQSGKYSMVVLNPFASETMNDLTIRSFSYLKVPNSPESIEMNFVLTRFIVYPSLKVEAEFKFDFYDKESKK